MDKLYNFIKTINMQISNPNEQSEEITNKQRELKNLEEVTC
jgi:hypothetical protein